MMKQNHQLFDNEKFEEWANLEGLYPEESVFIERHLCRVPRTAHVMDVGTGCGRIAFGMRQYGFSRLSGIDTSERLIEVARAKNRELDAEAEVEFSVQDARNMTFQDGAIDVIIAFQQVYCMIEEEDAREKAFREAYRVLAPGGIMLVSLLNWEGRWYNRLVAAAIAPLKILRGDWSRLDRRYLCWLKFDRGPNFKVLYQRQPYIYWCFGGEIEKVLERIGFQILDVASSKMLQEGLHTSKFGGMYYIAARKPLTGEKDAR
jgi:SAM-dependent methyltransferase